MPQYPYYEEYKADTERNHLVAQSNKFIRETQNNLTLQQQKIILYIISKIKPTDDDLKTYEIDIKDFCKVCGIDDNNGNNYKYLRDSIIKLHNASFWFITDKKMMLLDWIQRVEIQQDTTKVSFRLDDRLKPYLLELKENFTAYELGNALVLSSKHSINLYQLLKSYVYLTDVSFTIDELKQHLQIDNSKYPLYKDFRRYIIDKAIAEINEYTDIVIEYKARRSGRITKYIDFYIRQKETGERLTARLERDCKFDRSNKNG